MSSMQSSENKTSENDNGVRYDQFTNESSEETGNQRNNFFHYLNSIHRNFRSSVQKHFVTTETWFADYKNKFNTSLFLNIFCFIIIICLATLLHRSNSTQIENNKGKYGLYKWFI